MLLEHDLDRVEVILGRQVDHRVVLVIKLAMIFGVLLVALDEVKVVVPVRFQVPVRVHRDEAGVLQEAGVDATQIARVSRRNLEDDVIFKPVLALAHRQRVDLRRVAARVDRAAHHRHRLRQLRIFVARHQRNCGEHRHRRLTHRNDVHVRAQVPDELDHIVDVVVEVKRPGGNRHHAER